MRVILNGKSEFIIINDTILYPLGGGGGGGYDENLK